MTRQQAVPGTESAVLEAQARRDRLEALEAVWATAKEVHRRMLLLAGSVAHFGHKGADTAEMKYERAKAEHNEACERLYEMEGLEAPWEW